MDPSSQPYDTLQFVHTKSPWEDTDVSTDMFSDWEDVIAPDTDTSTLKPEHDAEPYTKLPIRPAKQTQDPQEDKTSTDKHPDNNNPIPTDPLTSLLLSLGFPPLENPSTLPPSFLTALNNRFTKSYLTQSQLAAQTFPNPFQTHPIFVIGAFIFPAVLSNLFIPTTRHEVALMMTPGTVTGYQRRAVKHAPFPAAFPSPIPGDKIQGMVVFGVDDPDWRARMHRFQNGMYTLQRGVAEVVSEEGETVKHEVVLWVWNGPSGGLVAVEEGRWSVSRMMRGSWLGSVHDKCGELRECPGLNMEKVMMMVSRIIECKTGRRY